MQSPKVHPIMVIATAALSFISAGCGNKAAGLSTYTFASGSTSTASAVRDAEGRDCALVRFVNAYEPGGVQDLYFGGQRAFPKVAYLTVTPYVELPGERRDFRLFTNKEGILRPLISNSEGLWEGRRYTIIASGRPDGNPMVQAYYDDLAVPPPGKARLKFIHLAPALRELDVYAGASRLFSGVALRQATPYVDIDAGKLSIGLHRAGQKATSQRVRSSEFVEGRSYTFIISGGKSGGRAEVIRIEDALISASPPVTTSLKKHGRTT